MHSVERKIELGMKVAVRRGVHEYVGVVIRVEDEHVVVCWMQSEHPEEVEYRPHCNDVKPIVGWV
jgi:hypothetical protein